MISYREVKDSSYPGSSKPLQADNSTALRGAALAFSSPSTSSGPAGRTSSDGARIAALIAGHDRKTGPLDSKNREIDGGVASRQRRQRPSTLHGYSPGGESFPIQHQSPSQNAAVIASSSSPPAQVPRSHSPPVPRRQSPLNSAHHNSPMSSLASHAASTDPTSSLVQLYEQIETSKNKKTFATSRQVSDTTVAIVSPSPIRTLSASLPQPGPEEVRQPKLAARSRRPATPNSSSAGAFAAANNKPSRPCVTRSQNSASATLLAQNSQRPENRPKSTTSGIPTVQGSIALGTTFSTTSLVPQLNADSLANAMVASSLASSRAASPSKPPLPLPRRHGKPHGFFYRSHSSNDVSRTPSPAKQMRQTLRQPRQSEYEEDPYEKRRSHFMKKHPNKHHEGDRKRWRDTVSERERKRYEGVWAANKNIFLPIYDRPSDTVCNVVVRDIWQRSRLPDDVLEEVWELVDTRSVGALAKEEFVVGMWLIDQRLKGRKLPVKVSESVWESVRMLSGIKLSKRRGR
ncbi:MAG: hypothetical protein Q9191_000257 [Dirinaria sp. TL-2023a]